MKANAPALTSPLETTLTVLSGSDKGSVYRVVSSRVSLGRGTDNDIVINDDPQVSRHHAEILLTPSGFEIRNLTENNSIEVDGRACKSAPLKETSIFALGGTKFRFAIKALVPALPVEGSTRTGIMPRPGSSPGMMNAGTSGGLRPQNRPSVGGPSRRSAPAKSNFAFRLIVVGIIGFVVWMVNSESPKKAKDANQLRTEQQITAEIESAEKLRDTAEKDLRERTGGSNNVAYQQAQEAYVKGFRDYKRGQYERAQDAFQACLSLFPSHILCTRYLRQAQRKFNELVQYHMVLGRKYRDQNQFTACRSAFRNVMVMIKDQSSSTYKEAKANYEVCDAHLEERF